MQIAFYFGYMAVVCYAFLLMLGTVGFRASLTFVRLASQGLGMYRVAISVFPIKYFGCLGVVPSNVCLWNLLWKRRKGGAIIV